MLIFHLVREDDFLSCSYEDYMNSLLTIYDYVDLSLQKNLQLVLFLSQASLMGYLS